MMTEILEVVMLLGLMGGLFFVKLRLIKISKKDWPQENLSPKNQAIKATSTELA